MLASYPAQASATADANGAATATIAVNGLQRWVLRRISVSAPSVNTAAIYPCRVYRNFATPGNLISATRTGAMDTDDNPQAALAPAEALVAVWEGLPPGTICTLTIEYTIG